MTDCGLLFDAKQYGSRQIPFRVVCPEVGCCNVSENDIERDAPYENKNRLHLSFRMQPVFTPYYICTVFNAIL